MKILALDTSTFVSSVALADGEEIVRTEDSRVTTHSEQLLPMIDRVLGGLAPKDLDLIACGGGPGSFTGLRIGLATAKGLAYALGKPLVLVSSLAALALDAGAGDVLAVLDARKREVYAGLFRVRGVDSRQSRVDSPDPYCRLWTVDCAPLKAETVISPSRLREYAERDDLIVVGDGAIAYPDEAGRCGRLAGGRATPGAAAIARLALARGTVQNELVTGEPTYIRPSEAEIPKPRTFRKS
jgi:tRNA threonylcarbamoyladenosine biosynthesis protein TsaB